MNITIDQIKQALSHVNDPDLGKDLITLNMIDNIAIQDNIISFDLVLTTPACPMKQKMKDDCLQAIASSISPEVEVQINFTAKVVSPHTIDNEGMKKVKHIIAVGSGKGGVGKSTVAANLALALSASGAKVALVDADIYGPSIPTLFNLLHAQPKGVEEEGKTWLLPIEKHGIKLMSIGFFVDPCKAVLWRGPMA
ncbi:MAG: P-loop NTPase, partial [Bacteroidales bacterium]